jgi:hypothetical protein
MSAALENLKQDVRMRDETDKFLSPVWIAVPVLLEILILLSLIESFMGFSLWWVSLLSSLLSLVLLVFSLVFLYMLIKRRTKHFYRQQLLLDDVVLVIRRMTSEKNVESADKMNAFERNLKQTRMEEEEKNAVLWTILTIIPFVGLYVLYFLTGDFYKHERREDNVLEDLKELLSKCNLSFDVPRRIDVVQPIPKRSFVLYLVLSIVTAGIFGVYWVYSLVKDPNNHFKYHVAFEEKMVEAFSGVLSK